jgi:hypothetical protein
MGGTLTTVPVLRPETATRRETFFKVIFNAVEGGYVCIARRVAHKGAFEEKFFRWPHDIDSMMLYIDQSVTDHDVWFCPMTFGKPRRIKENVAVCPSIWADLDSCPPEELLLQPTVLVLTSPDRHQALWILRQVARPAEAEAIAKNIAYRHAPSGADTSGWDLTQLLRVPFTYNHKYTPLATVRIVGAGEEFDIEALREAYPVVEVEKDEEVPFPESFESSEELLQKYRADLDPSVYELLTVKPQGDWSGSLWRLEMLLAESGLTKEEMFAIVRTAACNKYERDDRNEQLLWKEVCKAWTRCAIRQTPIDSVPTEVPELMSEEDLRAANADETFIERYIEWAKTVGDAAHAYHQAGAFTCLSAILSGNIQLPTSFGTIIPNLWFLLLADTTLTRKSTALDLAIDLLIQVDPDVIMATDGSIEGLFTSLSFRPGRPSVFLRDEFSGLLEAMTKKDYYAGMSETLTKMYDGKFQKRVLRRETIEVRDPRLLIFAGGIKTKILSLLQYEHVSSGFLPRFILIAAESNIDRLRPLGPPRTDTMEGRQRILEELQLLKRFYSQKIEIKIGEAVLEQQRSWAVELTTGAWELYNMMEQRLLQTGLSSNRQDLLTPTMDRLAKSGLKAAILIAASRKEGDVRVTERDIYKAFSYVIEWRDFAIEAIRSIGLTGLERQIESILKLIKNKPGILRGSVMQNYHLSKREADMIFDTMEQRGLINRVKAGRGEKFTAV